MPTVISIAWRGSIHDMEKPSDLSCPHLLPLPPHPRLSSKPSWRLSQTIRTASKKYWHYCCDNKRELFWSLLAPPKERTFYLTTIMSILTIVFHLSSPTTWKGSPKGLSMILLEPLYSIGIATVLPEEDFFENHPGTLQWVIFSCKTISSSSRRVWLPDG